MLEIYGADSRLVYRGDLEPFASEKESCVWDGRAENGIIVAKGTYTAYLQVRGTGSTECTQSEPISVVVDTASFVPLSLFSAGGISSSLVPALRLMPKGSLYSACTGGADFSLRAGFKTSPAFFGFAYAPLNFLEVSCTAGTEIKTARTKPLIVQGCLKAIRKNGAFRYGALLGGAYSSDKTVSVFNEGILHTGILLAADYGPLCIGASEQAYFGSAGSALHPFNGNLKTGISAGFQKGFYAIHLSAVLFSPFSSNNVQSFGRIQAGSDLCILIPKTLWMPAAGIYYTQDSNGENGLAFLSASPYITERKSRYGQIRMHRMRVRIRPGKRRSRWRRGFMRQNAFPNIFTTKRLCRWKKKFPPARLSGFPNRLPNTRCWLRLPAITISTK